MNQNQKKNALFWLITVLIPLFIFLAIEMLLFLGGYEDEKQELFIEAPNTPEYLIANARFIERYFPSFVPEIAPNAFRKQKKSNTFRVFVFGGSSAEGFPYNFYTGFADQLEQQLLLNTQGLNIEVVNLGMTAVNSYVIRDLAKRVLPYEPDAVIIYAGHNEYYGSFGAATTQFGFSNSIELKRFLLWLKDWRFYQLLEHTLQLGGSSNDNQERRTRMAKVISESDIPLDSDIYRLGIQQFEENISDVIELFKKNSVPIFMGTVASNLKDQAPLSDDPEVLAHFEQAQSTFNQGNFEEAYTLFMQAKEMDGTRFRAPEAINQVIERIAKETNTEVIPIQSILRSASQSSIEDESLFIDHLHPNDKGHKMMADGFFQALSLLPRIQAHLHLSPIKPPSQISTFERAFAEVSIARLMVGYPFVKNISIDEELRAFDTIYQSYLERSYIDSIAAVASKEQVFVPLALTEVVSQARKRSDSTAIVQHSYDLLKWQLRATNLIESSIEFTLASASEEPYLINILHQVINDGNNDPRYIELLSSLYLLDNNTRQASYWLNLNESMTPNAPRLLYNYSRYYLLEGDTLKAAEYYQRFMATQRN